MKLPASFRASFRAAILAGSVLALGACEMFEPTPPPARVIDADVDDVVDDHQIVVLARTSASAFSLVQKSARRGYVLQYQEELSGLDLVMLVLTVPSNISGPAAIRELESMEPGVSAGVNHAYRVPGSDASGDGKRRYANKLLGWPDQGCRADTVIGIIDAIADTSDPALAGVPITSRDFTTFGPAPAGPPKTDHGTVTAEILAGEGRLTGVRLQNAGVISDNRQANEAAGVDKLVRALDWMQTSGVRLVNISLAGPYNKILDRSLHQAISKGMIIVAAAGNTGADSPPRYPAAFDGVIAVTAIDVTENIYDRAVRGDHIDFAAPGVDVFVPVGEGKYISGTSIAAPYVTARIAADPRILSAKTGRDALKELAGSSEDLGTPGRDNVYGYGLPKLAGDCAGSR